MRSANIRTAQNVTIEFKLASYGERVAAFLIDLTIQTVAILMVSFLCAFIYGWLLADITNGTFFEEILFFLYFLVVLTPLALFYNLFCESIFNGNSLGKYILGIKVVRLDGRQPVFTDYAIRSIFRMLEIWFTLGGIATLMINSNQKYQRLGDLFAHTTVTKVRQRLFFGLKDLQELQSHENYEPVYPEVKHYNDDDMILVKESLQRYQKHKNEAHFEVIQLLAAKFRGQLELSSKPKDSIAFLRQVLKDYVALTR